MIEFQGVTKILRSGNSVTTVLNNATLVLPTDKRLAILGPRGSGKTTLIRLLAGLTSPTEGYIERFARVSFPVGFVGGIANRQSALHQIRHAAEVYGADPDEVVQFISSLPGMAALLNSPMHRIPQQSRLCLGYALGYAIPFDVYLIDNATSVGDTEFRALLDEAFQARSKSSGMILATHHLRLAQNAAECGAVMHNGNLVYFDAIQDAVETYKELIKMQTAKGAQAPNISSQDGISS